MLHSLVRFRKQKIITTASFLISMVQVYRCRCRCSMLRSDIMQIFEVKYRRIRGRKSNVRHTLAFDNFHPQHQNLISIIDVVVDNILSNSALLRGATEANISIDIVRNILVLAMHIFINLLLMIENQFSLRAFRVSLKISWS